MSAEILVVDDEQAIADLVEVYLKSEGYTVHKCSTAADALAAHRRHYRLDEPGFNPLRAMAEIPCSSGSASSSS